MRIGTVIGPRLSLRQAPSLALTPELRQAIRILQMPSTELLQHVEQELELNPLLERVDAPAAEAADWPEPAAGDGEDGGFEDWSLTGGDGPAPRREQPARGVSLREHLAVQIATDLPDPRDRVIALALLESLDEAGYLTADLADVARRLGTSEQRICLLLPRFQQFDPPGVFARSLAECLGAQLADRRLLDKPMSRLLRHLDLVAGGQFERLARLVGVDDAGLRRLVARLRRLDPKPGLAFEPVTAESMVPDVLMLPRPGGGWTVELNPDTLPRLIVNRRYYAELVRTTRSAEARNYLSDRLASGKWLMRALDQRARTILKVASEIVHRQDGFFIHGVGHLKPLVLRDVAAAVRVHESTVSRATSNKFMATPRGTFELRYFFASGLSNGSTGECVTAKAVKSRIRELIERENPREALSDDRLVELLREGGVQIARRTVTKYREDLRIPSSVERRRRNAFGR
ncbi:MAG: RNA polymerase factor sigma-54 [Rhodospirillales bacterium]|nr:RNA polymerase factor sigma-54 [Rhodospirillales bacterium]